MKRVCRVPVPNFSPFSLSALSTGINAVQFHSLNSAFPGQSQAFTEFSPYTPNSGGKKKNTHTKAPPHLSNHPFILYLCSCNLNWAFFKCSFNSVLLQEVEQGGDTGWAKGNMGNQLVLFFFPSADNYNFLPSDQIAATGRCPGNNQTAQIAQAVVEKCPYLCAGPCEIPSMLFHYNFWAE